MVSNLFQWGKFKSTSGLDMDFKIECDALTDDDWECIAQIISNSFGFKKVYGVPTGGEKLAKALEKFVKDDPHLPILIVDDVLTTGKSILEFADTLPNDINDDYFAVVLFDRRVEDKSVFLEWLDVHSVFELSLI